MIFNRITGTIDKKGAAFLVLIDPDKIDEHKGIDFVRSCVDADVDGFLIGGSLMMSDNLTNTITLIKNNSSLPTIIFPGDVGQIHPDADALLYISLISGRNADQLIGKHVMAAPYIKKTGIEPISTGYMLIESGKTTTAEYMSGSKPIPRNKPEIAAATALAAEYMGMKMVYLEGGSGAEWSVPNEIIAYVSKVCSIPIIVGGGIVSPQTAREKVESGARIIVTGNYFEDEKNWKHLKDFAKAVHKKESTLV